MPRATPWVSMQKRLRPVRAKVWSNGWLLLFPLQGAGTGNTAPRALPWASYVTHQILCVLFALIYVIIKLHRSEEPIRNSHHKFYSLVPLQPRFLVICSWYCWVQYSCAFLWLKAGGSKSSIVHCIWWHIEQPLTRWLWANCCGNCLCVYRVWYCLLIRFWKA